MIVDLTFFQLNNFNNNYYNNSFADLSSSPEIINNNIPLPTPPKPQVSHEGNCFSFWINHYKTFPINSQINRSQQQPPQQHLNKDDLSPTLPVSCSQFNGMIPSFAKNILDYTQDLSSSKANGAGPSECTTKDVSFHSIRWKINKNTNKQKNGSTAFSSQTENGSNSSYASVIIESSTIAANFFIICESQ